LKSTGVCPLRLTAILHLQSHSCEPVYDKPQPHTDTHARTHTHTHRHTQTHTDTQCLQAHPARSHPPHVPNCKHALVCLQIHAHASTWAFACACGRTHTGQASRAARVCQPPGARHIQPVLIPARQQQPLLQAHGRRPAARCAHSFL